MVTILNSGGIQIDAKQESDGQGKLIYNNFIGGVLSDFAQIVTLSTGKALVATLKAELTSGKTLVIRRNLRVDAARRRQVSLIGNASLQEMTQEAQKAKEKTVANTRSGGSTESNDSKGLIAKPGVAVDGVSVTYDPIHGRYERPDCENPTWIVLAHELIHALHYFKGTKLAGKSEHEGEPVDNEELQTVGLGDFSDDPMTGNRLRLEAGLKPRPEY